MTFLQTFLENSISLRGSLNTSLKTYRLAVG